MKKVIFFFIFSLSNLASYSQKIHFTDITNRWRYLAWSSSISIPTRLYIDSFLTDTIIHGTNYRKLSHLYNSSLSGMVFVREDTIAKKVFAIAEIYPDSDTTEQLLYDYTLNVSDTFRCKHSVHYVSSIDSVIINTVWHKVWHLFPYSTDSSIIGLVTDDYYVVEGIGSTNEPMFSHSPYSFEVIADLTCFNNRGTTPPLSHTAGPYFNNSTSCSLTFGLGFNNILLKKKTTSVFPNPINKTSKIVFPATISSGSVIITNSIGQQIAHLPFQNKNEMLIGDKIKTPGIYFYRVMDNENGHTYSGKFVN